MKRPQSLTMKSLTGNYTRPNTIKAQALAMKLQEEAAKMVEEANLSSVEDIPQEAIIRIFVAQMISPSKSANVSLQAAGKLAEMAGLTGKKNTAEDLQKEIDSILSARATTLRKVGG